MNHVVRPYRDEDREAYGYVRSMVYRGGEPVGPDEQLIRDDCIGSVVESDGKIVGACLAIDMTCTRGDLALLRCAGVASVGVVPEARASGAGSALMRGVLPYYRELGYTIASLYPFRASYYRRFGYEICGLRYEIAVPQRAMPRMKSSLPIRSLKASEHDQVRPCFEAFAKRYSGMSLRNDLQWRRQLGGDRPFQIYTFGDPVEAYVAIRLDGEFWEDQRVREVIYTSQRGHDAVLAFFSGVYANKTKIIWDEPGDSLFVAQHMDYGIEVRLESNIMYRLLDIPAALQALKAPDTDSGEFTLGVHDPELPENCGPWRVQVRPEGVSVEAFGGVPDLEFDIRAFTQCYLGEPSLESVAGRGRGEVRSAAALAVAGALLTPCRTHCSDRF